MEKTLTAQISVLDRDICQKCRLFELDGYATELMGDGEVIGTLQYFSCRNVKKCEYLRDLFKEAAIKTPPNVGSEELS